MSGTRKILIVGNGFDLAHFLPTKYEHFIHAMKVVENSQSSLKFSELFDDLLENDFILNKTTEFYDTDKVAFDTSELTEKLKNNGWFQYFKNYLDSGIETWIDFENEINRVLNSVCEFLTLLGKEQNLELYKNESYINHLLVDHIKDKYRLHLDILSFMQISDLNNESTLGLYFDKRFLDIYRHKILKVNFSKVFKHLEKQLNDFIGIFEDYIIFVNSLNPIKELAIPQVFQHNLETVYSFNYSSTIERLYKHKDVKYLHGKASAETKNKIVLGIAELENQLLKDEKAYGFVKYYQKLANDTDYQFLRPKSAVTDLEAKKTENEGYSFHHPIEIYIWGHSLDSSDSDYIKEIFSFNKGKKPSIRVIVYSFGSSHAYLANLIHILDRETVESWMKNEWLEFIETPDIYKLNFEDGYTDEISSFSKTVSEPVVSRI